MIKHNLKKLIDISSELTRLCQLAVVLKTYLDANTVCNETCSNALVFSEILLEMLEITDENLCDYIQQINIELYAPKNY